MPTVQAKRYDQGMWFMERIGMVRLRLNLLQNVHGDVLEIGAGTGANLALFNKDVRVTAVDIVPSRLMGTIDKINHNNLNGHFNASCANAHNLPFPDNSFDAVVSTLVFCSIPKPEQALAEIKRVLRTDGHLFMLEHVRGLTPFSRRLTDWLHPAWFALQGECHLNRETAITVQNAAFQLDLTCQHAGGLLQTIIATPLS